MVVKSDTEWTLERILGFAERLKEDVHIPHNDKFRYLTEEIARNLMHAELARKTGDQDYDPRTRY